VASIRKDINKVNQEGVSDQPHAYFMHIKELRNLIYLTLLSAK